MSPERAALIYLMEPIFAAMISIPWGLDQFTPQLATGEFSFSRAMCWSR